jgi:protein ImuA
MTASQRELISSLKQDILQWEGFRAPAAGAKTAFGLGSIDHAFPNQVFPTGVVHEFISECPEQTSATGGFIGGLISVLLQNGGACIWVSYTRRIYPPALKRFGIEPDRIIFLDVPRQKDVLWATEEALKCEGVAAVICETQQLNFMESRRLQLAVEKSQVTGFIVRKSMKNINTTACTARWQVKPVRSQLRPGVPGVGHPRWHVELLKVKNGNPGSWTLEWRNQEFRLITEFKAAEQSRRYA